MREPSDEEINKTIAEFMEVVFEDNNGVIPSINGFKMIVDYTKSIDALIPVVGKLPIHEFSLWKNVNGWWTEFNVENGVGIINGQLDKSPSRALALAIYHVIKAKKQI